MSSTVYPRHPILPFTSHISPRESTFQWAGMFPKAASVFDGSFAISKVSEAGLNFAAETLGVEKLNL
jgi:hypothetical protein